MSTRRAPRPTPPPQPLLSPSTLTFIGHWRGQLLITLIVLFFGFIYFILRDPIEAYSQRRREKKSAKARGALLALEQETPLNEETDRGREKGKVVGKRRKGSVLKVDQLGTGSGSSMENSPAPRKRGLSAATTSTVSSIIGQGPASPEAQQKEVEEVFTPKQKGKQKATVTPKTVFPFTPGPITPEIRLRRPVEDITPPITNQIPLDSINSDPVLPPRDREPWAIPLPSSPSAGPSRLSTAPASVSDISTDGRSELEYTEDTERTDSRDEEREGDKKEKGGFSIFPEEGYLPPSALASQSTKKKKRGKSRGAGGGATPNTGTQPLPPSSPSTSPLSPTRSTRNGRSGSTSLSQTLAFIPEMSSSSPSSAPPRPTHSRSHSRKTSLGGRPANMDIEDLLIERERTIDSLRAEIGLAKVEEARAREEADKARKGEERMKGEVDRVRRAGGKVEQELRRREVELQRQLNQTTQLISAQATRLGMIEQLLSSTGLQLPPPPSPLPSFVSHGQRISSMPASTLPSPLPYPMGYPSPLNRGGSGMASPMLAYPSPGMYISPSPQGGMLHPNSFSHTTSNNGSSGSEHHHPLSPSPFRRASVGPEPDYLAGPLSPGLVPYPSNEIGLGRPSSRSGGYRHSSPGSGSTGSDIAGIEVDGGVGIGGKMDEERRASIATSVLKKKGSVGGLKEVDERVEGLGGGEVGIEVDGDKARIGLEKVDDDDMEGKTDGIERDDQEEHDNSSSSSSQSPRRILITPGPADPDAIGQNDTDANTDRHREAINGCSNGHGHGHGGTAEPIVFIREEFERLGDSRSSSSSGSARIPGLNGIKPSHQGDITYPAYPDPTIDTSAPGNGNSDIPYTPTFASLAHTPEQLKEIARLREMALKRYNSGTGTGNGKCG